MSDYINIHAGLLRAAANELLHAASGALIDSVPGSESFTEVPASLVEGLRQYMADGDSDDHSVGLCTCETNALAYELELALSGQMTCPDCGGDGMAWDEAKAQAFRDQELGWDDCFAGYVNCPKCNGKGTIQIS